MSIVIYYYIIITVITFLLYGFDKISAIYAMRRTPEKTLHLLAFAGGVFGAWVGMILFRHKKNKLSFILLLILASLIHGYILVPYIQQIFYSTSNTINTL